MMDVINFAAAAGLLAACIALVWFIRTNTQLHLTIAEQRAHIAEQRVELDEAGHQAGAQYDKGYQQGMLDKDREWRAKPLYQEGWQHALQAQTGCACEMQLVRESGELINS